MAGQEDSKCVCGGEGGLAVLQKQQPPHYVNLVMSGPRYHDIQASCFGELVIVCSFSG